MTGFTLQSPSISTIFTWVFLILFSFFVLLELSPKFFKSLDQDAFLKLLQVHYYELFKRFSTHVYYYELFLSLFSKNHPLNAGLSIYEQHSRFTFLKHNTLNPTTGFLSRGSYRVMIDGVCPSFFFLRSIILH